MTIENLERSGVQKLFSDDFTAELDSCRGAAIISGSFTVDVTCSVHYENYPFDTQICFLALNSRHVAIEQH